MLEFASRHPNAMAALPEPLKERLKLPRGYIANVIHSTVGDEFAKWVSKKVD